jgi:hypothetical protein
MDNLTDNEPNKNIEIAADGDVILVVGPNEVKLRVYSFFLKTASKPFLAIFKPHWKEGHDLLLSRDVPIEVPLPEDDVMAMLFICSVIHHRNERVPRAPRANDVLRIAITANKYGCVDVLKFASKFWLQPRDKDTASDLMLLTTAAYLFHDAVAFRELTKVLVLTYSGPYLALSCKEIESAMTWKVFCKYLP